MSEPTLQTSSSTLERWLKVLPQAVAMLSLLFTVGILGCWLAFPGLKEFCALNMKANTAASLSLASLSLLLLTRAAAEGSRTRRMIGRGAALLVVAIGALTLMQYLFGWNLGIDELVAKDFPNKESSLFPGRMAPNAAFKLILTGLALFWLDREPRGRVPVSQLLQVPVLLISCFALLGYLYGVTALYQIGPYIRLAWLTALCFVLISIGTLLARPRRFPISVITDPGPGGYMARRLLPISFLLPSALGWLRLISQEKGIFDATIGISLLILTIIVLFSVLIWVSAKDLNRLDTERAEWLAREQKARQEALTAAIHARDEFLSITSHELKTPLTSLKLQLQILKRRIQAEENRPLLAASEKIDKAIEASTRQADRLASLVEDLLDISRIQGHRLSFRFEPIQLRPLIEDVAERFADEIKAARCSLVFDTIADVTVHWDPGRIEQVLVNLISNAVKYAPGSRIEISATRVGRDTIRVSVTDEGPGVPQELIPRIFERFERAGMSRNVSGLGLGLYIVAEIIKGHQGSIHVESEVKKGARFVMDIPIDPARSSLSIVQERST